MSQTRSGHPRAARGSFSKASLPGRRQRRQIETRQRIFRAALDLFAKRGYLETTVEDITEAADVGKGTFFNYFPTKEHVLEHYGEERVQTVERGLELARSGKRPVLSVLKELATDLAGQSSESPELLRAVFAANLTSAAVLKELQKRLGRARRLLSEIIVLGQKDGQIRPEMPADEMARLFHLIFMGVTVAWAANPDSTLRSRAEEVWELLYPSFAVDAGRSDLKRKP